MKKALLLMVIIISISAIVVGKVHWDNKTKVSSVSTVQPEKTNTKGETSADNTKSVTQGKNVAKFTKNLPEDIQAKIISASENGETLNLVIAGSGAVTEDPTGWPTLLKQELEASYGKEILNVIIKPIIDKTSLEVVQEGLYQEIVGQSPDILLFEPFILYDNGKVTLEDRLANLQTVINEIKDQLPEVSILLQPANPLLKATFYPNEVEQLKVFAEQNNYTYLNHWEAWPDHQSDEIGQYLIDGAPNQKGHEVWAGFLRDYFISE